MGTGDLCRVPPATVHHGRARQCSGTGPCGYCRRVLYVPGPRGQHSGKIRFIEKPGIQDEGGRHVAKRSSDPRVAYPEVSVQVRDLVRVVGIVDRLQSECLHVRSNAHTIGQAKSSIPALSYFQVGGMNHDQELYAKVSYIPSAYRFSSYLGFDLPQNVP